MENPEVKEKKSKKINNNDKLKKESKTARKERTKRTVNTKKDEKRVLSFSLIEMIIIIIVVSLVVSVVSGYLVFKNYSFISKQTSYIGSFSELDEFVNVYEEVLKKYYKEIDKEKIIDSAINGMLSYLDQYTSYIDEESTEELQTRLDGEYKGIGVEISQNNNGQVVIVGIFEGSPADDAGLKPGDILISIDGETLSGKTSGDVATMIKGSKKEKITLRYLREEENETVVFLNHVIIPSVNSKIYEDNIGYIGIDTFSATTYSQVKEAKEELESKNINSLIIDVRNNTGGYLTAAKSISDLFIEKGKILYQLKYKDGKVEKYEATTNGFTNYKIVVLINGASASASEILTSALKESYGATVVGTKSYGKGTIQETGTLTSGAMIKYTSAYWLTPNGNSINEVGIEPDIEIETASESSDDNQLQKAIEILK